MVFHIREHLICYKSQYISYLYLAKSYKPNKEKPQGFHPLSFVHEMQSTTFQNQTIIDSDNYETTTSSSN